jgi:hypothetical protein
MADLAEARRNHATVIPDEAVEAAAKGIWEARPMERVYEEGSPDYGAAKPWADVKQYQRDRCMTLARFALEAAAPHLLKDLRELVEDMEAQPPSEIGPVRGMAGIIRTTMKGML